MLLGIPLSISCKRGSTAVEFALTFPCLLLMLVGCIGYGISIATINSVQQLAAEAARASISGLSSQDRESLARTFIAKNITAYPLLDANMMAVAVSDGAAPDYAFSVAVTIDLTNSFLFQFRGLLPMPAPKLTRSAVVRRGGF